jgi:hypothetical protein
VLWTCRGNEWKWPKRLLQDTKGSGQRAEGTGSQGIPKKMERKKLGSLTVKNTSVGPWSNGRTMGRRKDTSIQCIISFFYLQMKFQFIRSFGLHKPNLV